MCVRPALPLNRVPSQESSSQPCSSNNTDGQQELRPASLTASISTGPGDGRADESGLRRKGSSSDLRVEREHFCDDGAGKASDGSGYA